MRKTRKDFDVARRAVMAYMYDQLDMTQDEIAWAFQLSQPRIGQLLRGGGIEPKPWRSWRAVNQHSNPSRTLRG